MLKHFSPYFQIPFVVVSPGPVPRTRQTKAYMIESACETFFYKEDLRDIEKKGYGVVFRFNASNHYCPTIVISRSNYALWQLEQLAMISMGSLSLIQEIDVTQLEDFQKVHLEVFKDQLSTTIQLFGPTIGATTCTAGAVAKASGVLFTNAPDIIPDSQDPQRSIDQPVPASPISGTSGSQPLPEKRKRSKKIYMCDQCSKEFPKRQTMMTIWLNIIK